ncbi:glycine betaine ABC transporter substrate-binding protein [uncultured Ramlibacter sp.]|uniref:glycine betaine ABC transporter substrate-binding protein n=1 Tax=uncultured Ramlibacter sp. TaxID=260755 RepID=UPI00261D7018|nr:glycine betaine ABC transporter substrate-binding protein [uncultured Ramlibacter sp.]
MNHKLSLSRRSVVRAALSAAALSAAAPLFAQSRPRQLRIGFQKFNTLNILKGTGKLEKALAPAGVQVEWKEFAGGSQVAEALTVGAIDVGHAADAIGIFQQASGKGLHYLAAESPYPGGLGLLVPRASAIQSVRDLKGRKIAIGRGYNIQYALIRALESAGLGWTDIEPVYLVTAADHIAAYQSGRVDAVGLWDPFLASAQLGTDSRLLFDGKGYTTNRTYHFALPATAQAQEANLRVLFSELKSANQWANSNPRPLVDLLAPQLGVDPKVLALATERRQYGLVALSPEIAADQQRLGDAFASLKLIPAPVQVGDLFSKLSLV